MKARMGIIYRGTSIETFKRNSGWKSNFCRSSDEVFPQSELETKSGPRRSPDEVCLQLKLGTESGSCRSPDEVYLQ